MAFDSGRAGPSRRQVDGAMNQAPTMAQPGAHIDTEPISDMSADADQISIDLSDGGESQRAGNAPARDDNQDDASHP